MSPNDTWAHKMIQVQGWNDRPYWHRWLNPFSYQLDEKKLNNLQSYSFCSNCYLERTETQVNYKDRQRSNEKAEKESKQFHPLVEKWLLLHFMKYCVIICIHLLFNYAD